MNANTILNFERSLVILENLASQAGQLATDTTAMPDGQGTVASRYADAIAKFGPKVHAMTAPAATPAPALAAAPSSNADPGATGSKTPGSDIETNLVDGPNDLSQVGDYFIAPNGTQLFIWLPGRTEDSMLPIRLAADQGDGWIWDGNIQAPTLTPSISCDGGKGWHGWLTAGILTLKAPSSPPLPAQNAPTGQPAPAPALTTIGLVHPDPSQGGRKFWTAGMPRE